MDLKDRAKSIKWFILILMCLVLGIFGSFIIIIFSHLYHTSEQSIIHMWKTTAVQAAQEIAFYISDSTQALDFTAIKANMFLEEDASHETVLEYLAEESEIYPQAVKGNTMGVYAYYKNHYLDGSGWQPDEDFEPTERPWYDMAIKANGEIIMVTPYVDALTGEICTTVARSLADNESVIAMDIDLGDVQRITTQSVRDEAGATAMIIDRSGYIVASSVADDVGTNIKTSDSTQLQALEKELALFDNGSHVTEISDGQDRYIVFSEELNSSWTAAMLLDKEKIFRPLRYIFATSGIALLAGVVIVLALFQFIGKKITEADHLKHLSETDRLTGILNRGAGEERIRKRMAEHKPGMLTLLDVDRFKSINDNYGHDVGDKVIIAVANCLKRSFRDSDVVMRLGGDEFVAFADGVPSEKVGVSIIERFLANVKAIDLPELKDFEICVSMGCTFYTGDDISFEDLYKRADDGTYKSKKQEGSAVTFVNE